MRRLNITHLISAHRKDTRAAWPSRSPPRQESCSPGAGPSGAPPPLLRRSRGQPWPTPGPGSPSSASAAFISARVSRQMNGSNQQLTPMILAPARAIRTAHSPALVPCNTALSPGSLVSGHWSRAPPSRRPGVRCTWWPPRACCSSGPAPEPTPSPRCCRNADRS